MPLFQVIKLDNIEYFPVISPDVSAAMKAIRYVWDDVADAPAAIRIVLQHFHHLYADLTALAMAGEQGPPPGKSPN